MSYYGTAFYGEYSGEYYGGTPVTQSIPTVTVTLTLPTAGQTFVLPATVALAATSSDVPHTTKIEFYRGSTLVGTATTSPYTASDVNPPAGSQVYSALLYSGTTTSSSTGSTVTVNSPLAVTLTSPQTGTTNQLPISIELDAVPSDTSRTTKVEFYRDSTLIGTVTTAPFTFFDVNPVAATYLYTVRAYEGSSFVVSSGLPIVVSDTSGPPITSPITVTLTSPTTGAAITLPASVALTATTSDTARTTKVEFYRDTVLIGTDSSSPYSASDVNPPVGTHLYTAKAYEGTAVSLSGSATVLVNPQPATPPAAAGPRLSLDPGDVVSQPPDRNMRTS